MIAYVDLTTQQVFVKHIVTHDEYEVTATEFAEFNERIESLDGGASISPSHTVNTSTYVP